MSTETPAPVIDISVDVSHLFGLILDALQKYGMTSMEIALHIGYPRDSVSPRMQTLASRGLVADTGTTTPNPGTGRRAIVWRATTEVERLLSILSGPAPKTKAGTKRRAAAMEKMLASEDEQLRSIAQEFMEREET
jgi:predicted ArsR family transcriptional regulator